MDEQKNSILIVDDDPMNITELSRILGKDYTLYVEIDGEGCIDTAINSHPDIIILDILMPGMSGFDVIKILKSTPETCDIPVVFVTGLNSANNETQGFGLGAADYIHKPFNPPIVKSRINNLMRMVDQVRNARRIGLIDITTGIGNRQYFNAMLSSEWRRASSEGNPIGLIIFNLDNFDGFNDTHGHKHGDMVLTRVAKIIEKRLADTPYKVARWGGDEFAILLPYANFKAVHTVAEDVRGTIAKLNFLPGGQEIKITLSAGIHAVVPPDDHLESIDKFISTAINALRQAKLTGRNKVCSAEDITE